jgi:hypothetical protein
MAADTRSIMLKWPTFFERMRGTWFLLKVHWVLLAGSVTALWSIGPSVSFKVISLPHGKGVTVTVKSGETAVTSP